MSGIDKERKAYEAMAALMGEAEEARKLFKDAGLEIPRRLEEFISGAPPRNSPTSRKPSLPTVPRPDAPDVAKSDWLWIPAQEAFPTTLALAVLGSKGGGPMRPKEIVDSVQALNTSLTAGGIYNVGPRLDKSGLLIRGADGWTLTKKSEIPVIHERNVWGPQEAFQSQEIASYRRMLIQHVLRESPDGLQIMQIVRSLNEMEECLAPVTKDTVKADMETLFTTGAVKKIGASKKFRLTAEKGEA